MKIALLLLLACAIIVARISGVTDYLTFDAVKEHRTALKDFVSNHYGPSVIIFIALFLSTAFFLPGAIVLMILGGFLFGVVWGVDYVNVAATACSALAFLSSRYLIGNGFRRDSPQLRLFNRKSCHGQNYLLFLRIVPLFPSLPLTIFPDHHDPSEKVCIDHGVRIVARTGGTRIQAGN
jgi:uncharacterized membrane protein YdjX (TVP38/TMEM64 family)